LSNGPFSAWPAGKLTNKIIHFRGIHKREEVELFFNRNKNSNKSSSLNRKDMLRVSVPVYYFVLCSQKPLTRIKQIRMYHKHVHKYYPNINANIHVFNCFNV